MAETRSPDDLPLLGGQLALDFANTLEWRGSERERDWLTDYGALLAWARRAGALDPGEAEALAAYADWAPGSAQDLLGEARGLREAVYRVASASAAGSAPNADDLEALNRRLAPLLAETRLTSGPDGAVAALIPTWGGASDDLARALWPMARAAFALFSGSEAAGRLRECPGRDCHWLFLDRSKNGSRRWCAMANCGNLAKARRHRERHSGQRHAGEGHAVARGQSETSRTGG